MAASCTTTTRLMSTATYTKPNKIQPIANVLYADLDVSPTKISHFLVPSKAVVNGGYDNVVDTAVREALLANGDADVLVAMESQVKYNAEGTIESIVVTGYPAKYVNFRHPSDEVLQNTPAPASPADMLGGLKVVGKK